MRRYCKDTCIYCTENATTREHVPPRVFLERPFPPNLTTLPACSSCNRSFSLDEEYFIALMTHIGTSPSLVNRIAKGGSVDRAMQRRPALDQRIVSALSVTEDGRVEIKPEQVRLKNVIRKVILGLYVLRYEQVPRLDEIIGVEAYPYNIDDHRPMDAFVSTFTERFQSKKWIDVQKNVFSYIFLKTNRSKSHYCCVIDLHNNAWGIGYVPLPKRCTSKRLITSRQTELPLKDKDIR